MCIYVCMGTIVCLCLCNLEEDFKSSVTRVTGIVRCHWVLGAMPPSSAGALNASNY